MLRWPCRFEECKAAGAGSKNHGKPYSCNQQLTFDMGCQIRHDLGVSKAECVQHCDRAGDTGCFLLVGGVQFGMCNACDEGEGDLRAQCQQACGFEAGDGSFNFGGPATLPPTTTTAAAAGTCAHGHSHTQLLPGPRRQTAGPRTGFEPWTSPIATRSASDPSCPCTLLERSLGRFTCTH